jgi:hypothetical protein
MKLFACFVAASVLAAPALALQNFKNCTGTVATPPSNSAKDSLSQLKPWASGGWEEWELSISEATNSTILLFRWTLGDPASAKSKPSDAKFSANVFFSNGSKVSTSLSAPFQSSKANGVYSIAIGENKIVWTDELDWYNITLNANGFKASLTTEV